MISVILTTNSRQQLHLALDFNLKGFNNREQVLKGLYSKSCRILNV